MQYDSRKKLKLSVILQAQTGKWEKETASNQIKLENLPEKYPARFHSQHDSGL